MRLFTICGLVIAMLSVLPRVSPAQHGPDSGTSVVRAGRARVEPGDRLLVKVAREPHLSDSLMVDARGEIALPKVGVVRVAGLGILELQDTVRARFSTFLRNPVVQVVVLRRIVISGEVIRSGVYYVDVGTSTLRDAVALAGGMTPIGHSKRVFLVRDGVRTLVPDWERAAAASDLRSGDEVFVGRRSWIALNATQAITGLGVIASLIVSIVTLVRR